MKKHRGYQFDYSNIRPEATYDRENREKKAQTIVAVLTDFFGSDLRSYSLLDLGCSTGYISNCLADYFGQVVGVDIDKSAIDFATGRFNKHNLRFVRNDSQIMNFPDNTFDVLVCAHIYEHVPDAEKLTAEIYRLLRAGGVCYFAAGNRLRIMEPHYRLPFLSAIPRPLAHVYIRLAGRGPFYYEKHRSYWGLIKLVSHFDLIDYTSQIIESPQKFAADYMIRRGSWKARAARIISRYAYWLCPTYIWLLRKPAEKKEPAEH